MTTQNPIPIEQFDSEFELDHLAGAREPDTVEDLRQLICELQAQVSRRDAELSEIQTVLAGTVKNA